MEHGTQSRAGLGSDAAGGDFAVGIAVLNVAANILISSGKVLDVAALIRRGDCSRQETARTPPESYRTRDARYPRRPVPPPRPARRQPTADPPRPGAASAPGRRDSRLTPSETRRDRDALPPAPRASAGRSS